MNCTPEISRRRVLAHLGTAATVLAAGRAWAQTATGAVEVRQVETASSQVGNQSVIVPSRSRLVVVPELNAQQQLDPQEIAHPSPDVIASSSAPVDLGEHAPRPFLPSREVSPQYSRRTGTSVVAEVQPQPGERGIPKGYIAMGRMNGVPPAVLFGVALQESVMLFGGRALPYPWTLCVAGRPERYRSYSETLQAIRRHVTGGTTNVDIGCMQINWRWHKDRLETFEKALDPYPNLAMGAQILREHFGRTGSWYSATALYHAGSINPQNKERAIRYAVSVFQRLKRLGIQYA